MSLRPFYCTVKVKQTQENDLLGITLLMLSSVLNEMLHEGHRLELMYACVPSRKIVEINKHIAARQTQNASG